MRTLSINALQSINSQETGEAWIVLIELYHDEISQPIRVAGDFKDVISNGDLYLSFPFEISLPGEDPDKPMSCKLKIDNVDGSIISVIRSISSPPKVTAKIVLASDPDYVELEFSGMVLKSVDYDANSIEGELSFEDVLNEPVSISMTPNLFPALF